MTKDYELQFDENVFLFMIKYVNKGVYVTHTNTKDLLTKYWHTEHKGN